MSPREEDGRPVTFENIRLMYRNFSGVKGMYHPEGYRHFSILVEDEKLAKEMEDEGWNIRWPKPLEDGTPRIPLLEVRVLFNWKPPPRVIMISSRGKTTLSEDIVNLLDWADIVHADVVLRPRFWVDERDGGKRKIKAYLKTGYFTIREDELEMKYIDVPESAAAVIMGEEGG